MSQGQPTREAPPPLLHILQPGEVVQHHAVAQDVVIAVTDHRLILADHRRTILDVPFSGLRRIQFDIERGRAATLVIVPEHISDEPQVLAVPIPRLREVAGTLAVVGERLNEQMGSVEPETAPTAG
jgi:hypothetical protein